MFTFVIIISLLLYFQHMASEMYCTKKNLIFLHLQITVLSSIMQAKLCIELRLKLMKFEVFSVVQKKNCGILGYDVMYIGHFPYIRRT
jgi:hypothetical protein